MPIGSSHGLLSKKTALGAIQGCHVPLLKACWEVFTVDRET